MAVVKEQIFFDIITKSMKSVCNNVADVKWGVLKNRLLERNRAFVQEEAAIWENIGTHKNTVGDFKSRTKKLKQQTGFVLSLNGVKIAHRNAILVSKSKSGRRRKMYKTDAEGKSVFFKPSQRGSNRKKKHIEIYLLNQNT